MKFNTMLENMRRKKGFAKTELAEFCGTSLTTFRRWESGTQEPRLSELKLLARALDTTVAVLAGEDTQKEKDKIVLHHGPLTLEIPATSEGLMILEKQIDRFTAGEKSPAVSSKDAPQSQATKPDEKDTEREEGLMPPEKPIEEFTAGEKSPAVSSKSAPQSRAAKPVKKDTRRAEGPMIPEKPIARFTAEKKSPAASSKGAPQSRAAKPVKKDTRREEGPMILEKPIERFTAGKKSPAVSSKGFPQSWLTKPVRKKTK
ncbi:MAG: helix-turn-helix domain-containing protein [Fretibacterium sp.]|nr:helix-turn-helix domain-containing protein [Fretibacterium sp.]